MLDGESGEICVRNAVTNSVGLLAEIHEDRPVPIARPEQHTVVLLS